MIIMSSLSSKIQATNAVNSLLSKVLPGSTKIDANKSRQKRTGGSKAQLINNNLKKRVLIQAKDTHRIKKKRRQLQKQQVKSQQQKNEELQQMAKLEVLKKHRADDTLTTKERKFLDKVIKKNVRSLKSWEVEDEEELLELQANILKQTGATASYNKTKTRKKKNKEFKEQTKQHNVDHRYSGLTPGLAPVGLSDEEESSEEEEGGY